MSKSFRGSPSYFFFILDEERTWENDPGKDTFAGASSCGL